MIHSIIAVMLQIIVGCISHNWWIGAAAGSFYFIGREYAQAEHRNIQQNYDNKRSNMPMLGGFEKRAWTAKGIADFVLPTIAVILVALLKSNLRSIK